MSIFRNGLSAVAAGLLVSVLGTGFPNARAQTSGDSGTSPEAGTAVQLPPVRVEGVEAPPQPGASSSVTREQLQQIPATEPSDILTGIPGVLFQNDGTPGLAVSVRGMQDFGRVNVMIDGARQDFQVSGHGANGSVYVDPALLAGVDVARGTVSTADGAGAIGGVVNLRTIGIDDVLAPGQHYGVLTTDMFGTNGYYGSGMIAGGTRFDDGIDVVAAYSMRNSGNYRDGDGSAVPDSYQRLKSGLIKTDIAPGDDQTLQLGAVFYHNDFGLSVEGVTPTDSVDSDTVTAKYHWAPRGNPLVDLHVNGFFVDTQLDEATPSFLGISVAPADDTHYHLTTLGGEIDNTSRFAIGAVTASINYGGEYTHDSVTTTDVTGDTGETPSGNRQVGGPFAEATLGWSMFQLIGGMRYDFYALDGSGVNATSGITSLPAGPFSIDKSASAFRPKITLAADPVHGLQVYGSYGLGFRPPALTETLMSGAHPGLDFLRFVPNPDLDPERTHGWEIGTKLNYRDVVAADDTISVKGDYFSTRIHDYIDQTLAVGGPDTAAFFIPIDGYFYQNTPGTTTTQGFELEASYDAHVVFANLSYSNIRTKLPTADYTGFDQILTTPPRSVFAATVGLRFLDERLVLGERTRASSGTAGQPDAETGLRSPCRAMSSRISSARTKSRRTSAPSPRSRISATGNISSMRWPRCPTRASRPNSASRSRSADRDQAPPRRRADASVRRPIEVRHDADAGQHAFALAGIIVAAGPLQGGPDDIRRKIIFEENRQFRVVHRALRSIAPRIMRSGDAGRYRRLSRDFGKTFPPARDTRPPRRIKSGIRRISIAIANQS